MMRRLLVVLATWLALTSALSAQLPKLYTNQKAFVEDGGSQRWVWCGASDFKLFARYLAGEDIAPVLQQRKDTGANILRVLLMYDGALGKFHPWEQEWPAALRAFAPLVGSYGLRVEYVVFADAQTAMPSTWLQDHWWHDITATLADCCANLSTVELANEWIQNGIDPRRFQRPPPEWRLLASRGSSGSDMPPWGSYGDAFFPPWDYDTFHPRRDRPKYLMDEDAFFIGEGQIPGGPRLASPHPVVLDEPIGFAEHAVEGRRANDTYSAQMIALSGRKVSGVTFHSDEGINSELWTGKTLTAARSFFRACTAPIGEDY